MWHWDIYDPRLVKAWTKSYVGWKSSFHQTSFWSPIGSRIEPRTKLGNFSAQDCVPRLFGVFKNMHKHKTTVKHSITESKHINHNDQKTNHFRNHQKWFRIMHCGAKSRCESKSAVISATKIRIFSEKLRKITINDPGPYIYIYICVFAGIYLCFVLL